MRPPLPFPILTWKPFGQSLPPTSRRAPCSVVRYIVLSSPKDTCSPRASNVAAGGADSRTSIGAKAGPSGATAANTCALVVEGPRPISADSTLEILLPAGTNAERYSEMNRRGLSGRLLRGRDGGRRATYRSQHTEVYQ